eukprot:TRINITY_DN70925_c0_g1_i1.p1 TRINITY_DN70925_c0_g1~~TRINITY_DN70925_c0_g1_i1.p1  ORF type:complete len:385 (-),score=38.37 TRINITY_DN70925_c0_g1_i1:62-1192(-)
MEDFASFPPDIVRYLMASDVYALHCAAPCIGAMTRSTEKRSTPRIAHMRLTRQREGEACAAEVCAKACWADVESLWAFHISLYAVQPSFVKSMSLVELDLELLFPEPFEEILPLDAPCASVLQRFVLRRCYGEVLVGLAAAVRSGRLPQLRELCLLDSPKGAFARAQGLTWPPRRTGLGRASPDAGAAEAIAEAVSAAPLLNAIVVNDVAAFAVREGGVDAFVTISKRPRLKRLVLTNCERLGHEALRDICSNLVVFSPGLEELNLAPAPLCTAAFDQKVLLGNAIANLVLSLQFLRVLEIGWCSLGDVGADSISLILERSTPFLRCGSSFHRVNLSHNGFGDRAANRLRCALLRHMSAIGEVHLLEGTCAKALQV